eukprot:g21381.t1
MLVKSSTRHWQGKAVVEYSFVAACSLPPLAFLLASQAPTRPVEKSLEEIESEGDQDADGRRVFESDAALHRVRIQQWVAVIAAAVAQFLFSGANSALLSWIVLYSADDAWLTVLPFAVELEDRSVAPFLVSLLQGSLMLGSFGASRYQRYFALWNLARFQVFAVLSGLLLWLPFTKSIFATVCALAWYGLAGGPLVTYCSTLLNQHCSPSGLQLAVINVGGNFGASAGAIIERPFIVGILMIKSGPSALPLTVSYAFLAALLGFGVASIERRWAESGELMGPAVGWVDGSLFLVPPRILVLRSTITSNFKFRLSDPAASASPLATLTGLSVLDGQGPLPMRPMYFAAGA